MRNSPFLHIAVLTAFIINSLAPVPAALAQEFRLPAPGAMVALSPKFNPPILKGIKVNQDNPFKFDFILDVGDGSKPSLNGRVMNPPLRQEALRLIKYFLASLTTPENDLWVNLSPYEKERIIPRSFGQTEMGRDLLAEDYMLKQITASLIYPEDAVGQKFWKRIYEEAAQKFGTTNIPVNTFNKVWIIPEKAVVYENVKAGTAYVVESKLKVMLEEDYLALTKNMAASPAAPRNDTGGLGSNIIREVIIPELTQEINEDKNFAQLRQVYNSLILAVWYKKKVKESILAQVYADKNKVAGVGYKDSINIEGIYQRYLQAFKKGVFNYIKETDTPEGGSVPRKYFSGGFFGAAIDRAMTITENAPAVLNVSAPLDIAVDLAMEAQGSNQNISIEEQITALRTMKRKKRSVWLQFFALGAQKLHKAAGEKTTVREMSAALEIPETAIYSALSDFSITQEESGIEMLIGPKKRESNFEKVDSAIEKLRASGKELTFKNVQHEAGISEFAMSRLGRDSLKSRGVIFSDGMGLSERLLKERTEEIKNHLLFKSRVTSSDLPLNYRIQLGQETLAALGVVTPKVKTVLRRSNLKKAVLALLKESPEAPGYELLSRTLKSLKLEDVSEVALNGWSHINKASILGLTASAYQERLALLKEWAVISEGLDHTIEGKNVGSTVFFSEWENLDHVRRSLAKELAIPLDWAGAILVRILYEQSNVVNDAVSLQIRDRFELKGNFRELTPLFKVEFENLFRDGRNKNGPEFLKAAQKLTGDLTADEKVSEAVKKFAAVKIAELFSEISADVFMKQEIFTVIKALSAEPEGKAAKDHAQLSEAFKQELLKTPLTALENTSLLLKHLVMIRDYLALDNDMYKRSGFRYLQTTILSGLLTREYIARFGFVESILGVLRSEKTYPTKDEMLSHELAADEATSDLNWLITMYGVDIGQEGEDLLWKGLDGGNGELVQVNSAWALMNFIGKKEGVQARLVPKVLTIAKQMRSIFGYTESIALLKDLIDKKVNITVEGVDHLIVALTSPDTAFKQIQQNNPDLQPPEFKVPHGGYSNPIPASIRNARQALELIIKTEDYPVDMKLRQRIVEVLRQLPKEKSETEEDIPESLDIQGNFDQVTNEAFVKKLEAGRNLYRAISSGQEDFKRSSMDKLSLELDSSNIEDVMVALRVIGNIKDVQLVTDVVLQKIRRILDSRDRKLQALAVFALRGVFINDKQRRKDLMPLFNDLLESGDKDTPGIIINHFTDLVKLNPELDAQLRPAVLRALNDQYSEVRLAAFGYVQMLLDQKLPIDHRMVRALLEALNSNYDLREKIIFLLNEVYRNGYIPKISSQLLDHYLPAVSGEVKDLPKDQTGLSARIAFLLDFDFFLHQKGDEKVHKDKVLYLGGAIDQATDWESAEAMLRIMLDWSKKGSSEAQNYLEGKISELAGRIPEAGQDYIKIGKKDEMFIDATAKSFRETSLIPLFFKKEIPLKIRQKVMRYLGQDGYIDSEYFYMPSGPALSETMKIVSDVYEQLGILAPVPLIAQLRSGGGSLEQLKQQKSGIDEVVSKHDHRLLIQYLLEDKKRLLAYYLLNQSPFQYPGTHTLSFERFEILLKDAKEKLDKEHKDIVLINLKEGYIKAGLDEKRAQEIAEAVLQGRPPLPLDSPYLDKDGNFIPQKVDVLKNFDRQADIKGAKDSFDTTLKYIGLVLKNYYLFNQLKKIVDSESFKTFPDRDKVLAALLYATEDMSFGVSPHTIYEKLVKVNDMIFPPEGRKRNLEDIITATINKQIRQLPVFDEMVSRKAFEQTGRDKLILESVDIDQIIRNQDQLIKQLKDRQQKGKLTDLEKGIIGQGQIGIQQVLAVAFAGLLEKLKFQPSGALYDSFKDGQGHLLEALNNYTQIVAQGVDVNDLPPVLYVDYISKFNLFEFFRFADGGHCCLTSDPNIANQWNGFKTYHEELPRYFANATSFWWQFTTEPRGGKQIGWFENWLGLNDQGKAFAGTDLLYLHPSFRSASLQKALMGQVENILFSTGLNSIAQALPEHIPSNALTPSEDYKPVEMKITKLQSLNDGKDLFEDTPLKGNVELGHQFFVKTNDSAHRASAERMSQENIKSVFDGYEMKGLDGRTYRMTFSGAFENVIKFTVNDGRAGEIELASEDGYFVSIPWVFSTGKKQGLFLKILEKLYSMMPAGARIRATHMANEATLRQMVGAILTAGKAEAGGNFDELMRAQSGLKEIVTTSRIMADLKADPMAMKEEKEYLQFFADLRKYIYQYRMVSLGDKTGRFPTVESIFLKTKPVVSAFIRAGFREVGLEFIVEAGEKDIDFNFSFEKTESLPLLTGRPVLSDAAMNTAGVSDISNNKMLTAKEAQWLTPKFGSLQEFMANKERWRKEHPDAKLVFISRHGEATSNLFRETQSNDGYSPLTGHGVEQAEGLKVFLKDKIKFDRFLSSDLERAYDTIRPLAVAQGRPIETLQALREVLLFPVGGLPLEQSLRVVPGYWERFLDDPLSYGLTKAGSIAVMKQGLIKLLDQLSRQKALNTLISTHGMTIDLILMDMFGIDYKKIREVFKSIKDVPNASIMVVAYEPADHRWQLLVKPDNSYLDQKLQTRTTDASAKERERRRYYAIAKTRLESRSSGVPNVLNDYIPNEEVLSGVSDARLKEILSDAAMKSPSLNDADNEALHYEIDQKWNYTWSILPNRIEKLARWINEFNYAVGYGAYWDAPASLTVKLQRGMSFNLANAFIAAARYKGYEAQYGVADVKKEILKRFISEGFYSVLPEYVKHVFARVKVEGRWQYVDFLLNDDKDPLLKDQPMIPAESIKGDILYADNIDALAIEEAGRYTHEQLDRFHDPVLQNAITQAIAEQRRSLEAMQVRVSSASFIRIVRDSSALFKDLILNGYINEKGELQDKFLYLGSPLAFKCDPAFERDKVGIFHTLNSYVQPVLMREIFALNIKIFEQYKIFDGYNHALAMGFFKEATDDLYQGIKRIPGVDDRVFAAVKDDPLKLNNRIASLSGYVITSRMSFPNVIEDFNWDDDLPVVGLDAVRLDPDIIAPYKKELEKHQDFHLAIFTDADIYSQNNGELVFLRSGLTFKNGQMVFVIFKKPLRLDVATYRDNYLYPDSIGRIESPKQSGRIISSKMYELLADKFVQAGFFRKYGISAPETIGIAQGKNPSEIEKVTRDEFIAKGMKRFYVKTVRGRQGNGVRGFDENKIKEAADYAYFLLKRDRVVIQQEIGHQWYFRPYTYRDRAGKLQIKILINVGGWVTLTDAGLVHFVDQNLLKELPDRVENFMGRVYADIEKETGEDPVLLSPDLVFNEKGEVSIFELNAGLFSFPASSQMHFKDISDELVPDLVDALIARAENNKRGSIVKSLSLAGKFNTENVELAVNSYQQQVREAQGMNKYDPQREVRMLAAYQGLMAGLTPQLEEGQQGKVQFIYPFEGADVIPQILRKTFGFNENEEDFERALSVLKRDFQGNQGLINDVKKNQGFEQALDAKLKDSYAGLLIKHAGDPSRVLILKGFDHRWDQGRYDPAAVKDLLHYLFKEVLKKGDRILILDKNDSDFKETALQEGFKTVFVRDESFFSDRLYVNADGTQIIIPDAVIVLEKVGDAAMKVDPLKFDQRLGMTPNQYLKRSLWVNPSFPDMVELAFERIVAKTPQIVDQIIVENSGVHVPTDKMAAAVLDRLGLSEEKLNDLLLMKEQWAMNPHLHIVLAEQFGYLCKLEANRLEGVFGKTVYLWMANGFDLLGKKISRKAYERSMKNREAFVSNFRLLQSRLYDLSLQRVSGEAQQRLSKTIADLLRVVNRLPKDHFPNDDQMYLMLRVRDFSDLVLKVSEKREYLSGEMIDKLTTGLQAVTNLLGILSGDEEITDHLSRGEDISLFLAAFQAMDLKIASLLPPEFWNDSRPARRPGAEDRAMIIKPVMPSAGVNADRPSQEKSNNPKSKKQDPFARYNEPDTFTPSAEYLALSQGKHDENAADGAMRSGDLLIIEQELMKKINEMRTESEYKGVLREIAKKTHPDSPLVSEDRKKLAEEVFKRLFNAFEKRAKGSGRTENEKDDIDALMKDISEVLKQRPFSADLIGMKLPNGGTIVSVSGWSNRSEEKKKPGKDGAMKADTGGIDLTPVYMRVESGTSEGIKFHLDPAMLERLREASGFVPVIISVRPVADLRRFLGIT